MPIGACSVSLLSWALFCALLMLSLGVLGRSPRSQPPRLSLQLPGREAQKLSVPSGDSWWLSPASQTCALLQVPAGGMSTLLLFPWGLVGILEFFICCNGQWQNGILHKHAWKDLRPFPAQCSEMGFSLPTTQISLLKSCGLIFGAQVPLSGLLCTSGTRVVSLLRGGIWSQNLHFETSVHCLCILSLVNIHHLQSD